MNSNFDINESCGKNISYRDLIECGDTFKNSGVINLPKSKESWLAINALATNILDPVISKFGEIKLTYGFCSPELSKLITSNIYPSLDQHCSFEADSKGQQICLRGGAAVDFAVSGISSLALAQWMYVVKPSWTKLALI